MKVLVDCCFARRSEVLHLTFHSSMNSAGDSPYARNEKEMQWHLRDLNNILDYIVNKKKIKSFTALEIYEKRQK